MKKKYYILLFLSATNSSFGMHSSPKEDLVKPLLEVLSENPTSYLNRLPKELIGELQQVLLNEIIYVIVSSKTLEAAVQSLNQLSAQAVHEYLFKDPHFTDKLIYSLFNKFNEFFPAVIGEQLTFEGASRWLKELWPQQEALLEAATEGNAAQVAKLIAQGVNVNARDTLCNTPLISAVRYKRVEVVKQLVEHGAAVDAQDIFNGSALMYAVYFKYPELVKLLLTYKANPHLKTFKDKTVLAIAHEQGNQEIIQLLEKSKQ